MYKYYKHNKSGKIVKVIRYDGQVSSLREITKYFTCTILLTTHEILLCGHSLQTNDYIIMGEDTSIHRCSSNTFNKLFKFYVIDRQFKYNENITKMLWEEILDRSTEYSIEKLNNVITITSFRTNVQIILSNNIVISRNESIYGHMKLELLIIDNCEEICI